MALKGYGHGYRPQGPDKFIKCDFKNRIHDFFRGRFTMPYIVNIRRPERINFVQEIQLWATVNLKSSWRIEYFYRPDPPGRRPTLNKDLKFEMSFADSKEAMRFKLEFS